MSSSSSDNIILSNHLKEVVSSSQQQNLPLEKDASSFHSINQQDFNVDVNIHENLVVCWCSLISCLAIFKYIFHSNKIFRV